MSVHDRRSVARFGFCAFLVLAGITVGACWATLNQAVATVESGVENSTLDSLLPCPTEDSDNCYWDAATRGNGQGTSFIVVDGVVYYESASIQLPTK